MKRLFQLASVLFTVVALGAAAPAFADDCGNCAECPKRKNAAAKKAEEPKAEKKEAKPAEKAAPAAPAAPAAGEKKAEGGTKCECGPGGKGCVCKKGECKCANCGASKLAAAEKPATEKPKCTCAGTKDCGCKKTDKGECSCKHEAKPKAA